MRAKSSKDPLRRSTLYTTTQSTWPASTACSNRVRAFPDRGILHLLCCGQSCPTICAEWSQNQKLCGIALVGHGGPVYRVAISGDGRTVLSSSNEGPLRVWNIDGAGKGRTPQGHTGSVRGIAISADGRVAVSASNDQTLKVWDVANSYYRNVKVARNRASGLARLFPRVP